MSLPVPPGVWDALREFLETGKSGQVIIDINEGRVMGCRGQFTVRFQVDDSPANALEFKLARRG